MATLLLTEEDSRRNIEGTTTDRLAREGRNWKNQNDLAMVDQGAVSESHVEQKTSQLLLELLEYLYGATRTQSTLSSSCIDLVTLPVACPPLLGPLFFRRRALAGNSLLDHSYSS